MAAQDNLSPPQFFHGTHAVLKPGDMIEPGHEANSDVSIAGKVYFTPQLETARGYAFAGSFRGEKAGEYTYRVEPTGEHELDPDGLWARRGEPLRGSRMSGHPLRVLGEVRPDERYPAWSD